MGNGSLDKVIQDLNRRFAAPLPEFYKRRIVFWYDEDGGFRADLISIWMDELGIPSTPAMWKQVKEYRNIDGKFKFRNPLCGTPFSGCSLKDT